ncbi:anaerobic ribonucleoside-triphosphate reductase activating protein [Mariniphaga sediminis]|jgi:anaerobic ribonucleoside-triphosphate reductase activating protein|uniref:Anaerobic ribonucleoside-triphosphate reductase activating protein n=1 Tax=Mariniphaga sediminis TaxID=1628158 RepID=A0A399D3R8_9BACT|nr:anaerobic ribonucleoside-triphosphate reductase activating protein [Mariniphaga sediminis]RIH65060.1 anaerobic ribonucleoside-triphosphate reductase activating protein [Mariniphaga sediminis]
MLKYYNYDVVFQEIPNEVTLAINITNCPNRCKGCHSPHLQKDIGENLNEERIISLMAKYASAITCFCFMGGDGDPQRVVELANFIRLHYAGIKVAWYSGCARLPEGFDNSVFQYIKLGGYIEELGALKSETSNQHLFEIQQDGNMKDVSHLFK